MSGLDVIIRSDIDTLVLPVAPDVSAVEVWGVLKDGLDGVWGGVDMRVEETDNPAGDGILWPGRVFAGQRYLGINGAHRSHDSTFAEFVARDRIGALLGRDLTVEFDGPLGYRSTTGFIKTKPDFAHKDLRTCTFGLVVVCPDPHWYGLPVTASGQWGGSSEGGLQYPLFDGTGREEYTGGQPLNRVRADNVGTRPSWPILRVDGPTSWARFTVAGRVIEMRQPLDDLTIDTRAGTATSGGVDVTGFLTRDDFAQVPAGGAWVSFQASDPVGFSVEVRPAWL